MIVRVDNELINKGSASSESPVNMAVYVTIFAPAKGLIALKGTLSSRLMVKISLLLIVFYIKVETFVIDSQVK